MDIVFSYAVQKTPNFNRPWYLSWEKGRIAENINVLLYMMGMDINLSKLLNYGIIRGSFALAAIHYTFVPNDIDFYYTPADGMRKIISELMVSMGFVYQYSDRRDYPGVKKFVWEKDGKSIDIIEVNHMNESQSMIEYLNTINDLKCCGYSISMNNSEYKINSDANNRNDILLNNILEGRTNIYNNLIRIEKYKKRGFLIPDPTIISVIENVIKLKEKNLC
jgi:hypothetical protein